ncbi:MAG: hypothetical protein HYX75_06245 [Acidobacteria bacterium]|nr:hypothetical protein [Acidobacteriota bacterium]
MIAHFNRDFFSTDQTFSIIGSGEIGGKASGLAFFREKIRARLGATSSPAISVDVPRLAIVATNVFDAFVKRNSIDPASLEGLADDRIAHLFQRAEMPAEVVGDLRGLIASVHTPLAVRSSSLLEDARERPFAGVYATKMTPNNQPEADARFRRLVEAIKFVYASTFFEGARSYRRAAGIAEGTEKMAVVIQEVVGSRRGDHYYPEISGVARSYNYYPSGHARPADGVVELALGLGKTIVDGEGGWSYSPAFPKAPPPYNTIDELLKQSQTHFWAVNMGKPGAYDPLRETEYLVHLDLKDAEAEGSLRFVASTFDPSSNRLSPGVSIRGPRLLNFAPILVHNQVPVNGAVKELLAACTDAAATPVEVELAVTIESTPRIGFLQVRPMLMPCERITIDDSEMHCAEVVVSSDKLLGNGMLESIADVVYVKPESFDAAATEAIALELDQINRQLLAAHRPYLLIGFGRWGTSDPRGGIPVKWGQISGAKVIVESTAAGMGADLSQGSHFFHNLTSFGVIYFSIRQGDAAHRIDWDWLATRTAAAESRFLRHIQLRCPLVIKADGINRRGVVRRRS